MYPKDKLAEIKAVFDKREIENAEKFQKERGKEFLTQPGISVKRLYTPLDLAERGFDYLMDLGFPGQYPYTRGITLPCIGASFGSWRSILDILPLSNQMNCGRHK